MVQALIADTLGDSYLARLPQEARRSRGATYTPLLIVDRMIAWAKSHGTPDRVVDPGAGTGRFAIAAARAFPNAEVIAVEIDAIAIDLMVQRLAQLKLSRQVRILHSDYRSIALPGIRGRTLFIGNPPYVRHHAISSSWKEWYSAVVGRHKIRASQLAGLHLHFFVQTLHLSKVGDFGCFISAAEWLDVNYGSALRTLLTGPLGGIAIEVFDPAERVFPDALVSAAITKFEVGRSVKEIAFEKVSATSTRHTSRRQPKGAAELKNSHRWSIFLGGHQSKPPANGIPLGSLFKVKRGQVTGCNAAWIETQHTPPLPERFLVPSVTRAKELLQAGGAVDSSLPLRRVIDLPRSLDGLSPLEAEQVGRFLEWAKARGADATYIAQHRRSWWAVGLYEPAPILCTYMGRRPPVFAENRCGARHVNIALGLYPKQDLRIETMALLVRWLNANVKQTNGRTYAGGLTKFEPRELESVIIPPIERFLGEETARLEADRPKERVRCCTTKIRAGAAQRAASQV